jgi:hypothetical protein
MKPTVGGRGQSQQQQQQQCWYLCGCEEWACNVKSNLEWPGAAALNLGQLMGQAGLILQHAWRQLPKPQPDSCSVPNSVDDSTHSQQHTVFLPAKMPQMDSAWTAGSDPGKNTLLITLVSWVSASSREGDTGRAQAGHGVDNASHVNGM